MRTYSDYEHQQPIEAEPVALDYAPPPRERGVLLPRIMLIAALAVCLLGTVLIFLNVESALFTGPALMLLGIYLLVAGSLRRSFWLGAAGMMHVGVCALFFGLVQLLNWSPSEAQAPFAALSLIYCWPALIVTFVALIDMRPEKRSQV